MSSAHTDLWLYLVTDTYAGNFERPLAAYAAGVYSEYAADVALAQYQADLPNNPFADLWDTWCDHHGETRVYIANSPLDVAGAGSSTSLKLKPTRRLTASELQLLHMRASAWCEDHGIKLLAVLYVTATTTYAAEVL